MPSTLTNNPQNSTPRIVSIDSSNGSTITRASISALSLQDYEDQDNKEVKMEQVYGNLQEARMAGAQQSSLNDLLMSRTTPLKMRSLTEDGSIIAPFSVVPRRHHINANFFKVEAGVVAATSVTAGAAAIFEGTNWSNLKMAAGATTGPGTLVPNDGADETMGWVLTVSLGDDVGSGLAKTNFNMSAITNIGQFFLPGSYVCVETNGENIYNQGSQSGAARTSATPYSFVLKVIGAYSYTDGGVEKAKVVVTGRVPAATFATYAANNAGYDGRELTAGRPTAGALVCLHNSVSNYEEYKEQRPSYNNKEMLVMWWQTSRDIHVYNEEYLKALEAPKTSSFWKSFKQLPIVEQKRQQFARAEKEFHNTIFYGDAIDTVNQTTANYANLEQVRDILDPSMTLEYKANTIGIYNQLKASGRIHNSSYGALNLDTIFEICYQLKRNREADGGTVDVIDAWTGRKTSSRIYQAMVQFYKAYYGSDFSHNFQPNQKIEFDGKNLWTYTLYDLPESHVQLAVLVDRFFDDRLDAFNFGVGSGDSKYSLSTRGNAIWMLDWSDIEVGLGKTRSVQRKTNELDDSFRWVIDYNPRHILHQSKTYQVRVYDAMRHAVIENFDDSTPIVSTLAGTVQL